MKVYCLACNQYHTTNIITACPHCGAVGDDLEPLEIKPLRQCGATVYYEVIGEVDGFTEEELINLCDRNNFGGYMMRTTNGATVAVYID